MNFVLNTLKSTSGTAGIIGCCGFVVFVYWRTRLWWRRRKTEILATIHTVDTNKTLPSGFMIEEPYMKKTA